PLGGGAAGHHADSALPSPEAHHPLTPGRSWPRTGSRSAGPWPGRTGTRGYGSRSRPAPRTRRRSAPANPASRWQAVARAVILLSSSLPWTAPMPPMSDVTRILSAIEQGDPHAASQLLPLVYDELRRLAAAKLAQEKPGQTLQATALVHEAYLRLV